MSQDQILDLLKDNPKKRFNVYDIIYSVPNGMARRIAHKNLKALGKLDCVHKEGECWYYAETKNRAD